MVTVLTSPILYMLYRRNYDMEKYSAPHVTENLYLVREGDIHMTE